MKYRKFAFRIGESNYISLKLKAKRAKITMTDFIVRTITGKEIVVIDNLKEVTAPLKGLGRNLNQLTTLANMDKIHTVDLSDTKQNLNKIYEVLADIAGRNEGL